MCSIVGHIAENCTSEQRLCYNCRQPGHESAACPQPRTVAAKQCYSCGGVGHIQAECPSLRVQSSGQKCYVSYPSWLDSFVLIGIGSIARHRIAVASVILLVHALVQEVLMVLPQGHLLPEGL